MKEEKRQGTVSHGGLKRAEEVGKERRYLDVQAFRFNERKDSDSGRFMTALEGILGKGLK
jgi:hypothetical protein